MATTVTTTGTGASSAIDLPNGNWSLSVKASSWGSAALEHDAGDSVWDATKPSEDGDAIVFTGNRVLVVRGGMQYRLNVSSHAAAITMTARLLSWNKGPL